MAAFISSMKLANLLTEADADGEMYVSILSLNRLTLGADPLKPSLVLDLSEESILPYNAESRGVKTQSAPQDMLPAPTKLSRSPRRSGNYWFELKGGRTECSSLKELLACGLRNLEHFQPGLLDRLSRLKSRSRRIVAHDPRDLYGKEHLVKDHSEKLVNGWWYGTNNSAQQTEAWLRRACELAGLSWGKDFKSSLTADLEKYAIEL